MQKIDMFIIDDHYHQEKIQRTKLNNLSNKIYI
jgi:hypothetical protein